MVRKSIMRLLGLNVLICSFLVTPGWSMTDMAQWLCNLRYYGKTERIYHPVRLPTERLWCHALVDIGGGLDDQWLVNSARVARECMEFLRVIDRPELIKLRVLPGQSIFRFRDPAVQLIYGLKTWSGTWVRIGLIRPTREESEKFKQLAVVTLTDLVRRKHRSPRIACYAALTLAYLAERNSRVESFRQVIRAYPEFRQQCLVAHWNIVETLLLEKKRENALMELRGLLHEYRDISDAGYYSLAISELKKLRKN